MLLSERLITLQAWLNNLPTEHFQKRPALLSLKGALLCTVGEGHLALSTLDRTILEFQKTDDLANLTLAFVRRAAAHRLVGDYASSLKDADEALRLSGNKPDLQFTYAEAERFKGISLHHLGADCRSGPGSGGCAAIAMSNWEINKEQPGCRWNWGTLTLPAAITRRP